MAIPETRTYARPAAAGLGLFQGAWWMMDGLRAMITGSYFGGEVGPWGAIPRAFGVEPESLAVVFLLLGVVWAAAAFGLWFKEKWSRPLAALMAVVSLPYAPAGTLIGAIVLVLLYAERTVPAESAE